MKTQDKPSILFVSLNRHQRQYFRQLGSALSPLYDIHYSHYSLSDFLGALIKPELPESVAFTKEELAEIIRFLLLKGKSRRFTGFRGWMHSQTVLESRAYFATLHFYQYMRRVSTDLVAVWNGINLPLAAAARVAGKLGKKTVFFENGYLQNTTTLDPLGVNYRNSLVNKPRSFYDAVVPQEQLLAALYSAAVTVREIRSKWYQSLTRKQTSSQAEDVILPDKFIFLPFQVHDDTQVLLYSPQLKSMDQFVDCAVNAVKRYNLRHGENLWIVAKEHPSDFGRVDYSSLKAKYQQDNILFLRYYPTPELIVRASGVITLNSTVGIEALVRHKPVITLGSSFYNVAGLVCHVAQADQLAEYIPFINAAPDHLLIDKFLYYLRYSYLAEGSWRQPDEQHFASIEGKISEILQQPFV
ncbi:hypothetical protein HSX37_12465|uniref:Capsular polysaccharide export protein n=1 Tax=Dendrosporobacter quercicolus TaxID=146817 RepID=A0A1G9TUR6_9FIRM|nr:hypothetical protein [Dendrosporobacter quercicolus]NSL48847.1 hypothetical protein [Dendrosporobacter quercicolus DSM 1736]SDM51338.1 capsular polysaccharide export protein [Dendrosporobacter quercicolus]